MIDSEQQAHIRTSLRDCRREGLIKFVEEFVTLLELEGFSFQDLLEALAAWMFRQRPNPDKAIKHLEDAALELHRLTTNQSKN